MDKIIQQIKSSSEWKAIAAKLDGWDFEKFPRRITIEPDKGEPVQDTFSVFWIWCKQLAKAFSTDKHEYSVDDIHAILCHKFLGYTDRRQIGNTWIEPALITLTYPDRKTKARMCLLLDQIDEWAMSVGVYLETRASSEYAKYRESQME